MSREIQLSLCIPTNGVIEWVKPVLDSIYQEKNPIGSFEVIVTDNGTNEKFYDFMQSYSKIYDNLIYKKTDAIQFKNQIEAFKLANGKLIKFVNHRMTLLPGALNYLLQVVKDNEEKKPFIYFLDNKCAGIYETFDEFVKGMSYWSSYSGGVAMWREDFMKMDPTKPFNQLFPHTNLIFSTQDKYKYIIDGHKIMESLPTDDTKKGKYNLFYAFGVEYPCIILELYRNKMISFETFEKVRDDNFTFLIELYTEYIILKRPCSYDLVDYKKNLKVFYKNRIMHFRILFVILKKCIRKLFYMINAISK